MLSAAALIQPRWMRRERCVVLDADFALGQTFLGLWRAWRDDPLRCGWLTVVAVVATPPTRAALASAGSGDRAQLDELLQAWPPPTPDLHLLDFEGGRVRLLLAVGDLRTRLPGLRVQADALVLPASAFAASADPRGVEIYSRKAVPGALLVAAVAAGDQPRAQAALRRAGFVVRHEAAGCITADYIPRVAPQRLPDASVTGRDAVVVGAGIAGAAVARALSRSGFTVTVLDRHAEPAAEASGNLAGLFHGVVHAGDGRYAQLYRAAALQAQRVYAAAIAGPGTDGRGSVAGDASGLLRTVSPPADLSTMQSVLARSALPDAYVQALDADAASAMAGVRLSEPAWFYPGGGWIDPRAWVRQALGIAGARFVGGKVVAGLRRDGDGWAVLDANGAVLAHAAVVVLAQGAGAAEASRSIDGGGLAVGAILQPMQWPLACSLGQVDHWHGRPNSACPLRMAVAGDGYALPLPDGGLVFGATSEPAVSTGADAALQARPQADAQRRNLQRLQRLCGLQPPSDTVLHGRAGLRVQASDRMPVAGALPLADLPARRDQARLLARARGLFVMTALGSRGLTLAPLLGEWIAAQACGSPWPLPQDLADAVDPARWIVRAARRG